ncbi:MAG: SgcJ/EcaC family oxidoreductase [Acidobacteria bacterium]|nr:MAG: SgcJ/EcaC family oxidoreductase [Acidobacteriota bacterium]
MLRSIGIALAFVITLQSVTWAQGDPGANDRETIIQAIERWENAWKTKDAELAARDYTEDADWTNAFGMRRLGRESIEALLTDIFKMPTVMAGSTQYEFHDLKFLGPRIALLRSRSIRTGQQLPDGTTQPPRRINHLRVFVKRGDRWLIVSHLISDERTPGKER